MFPARETVLAACRFPRPRSLCLVLPLLLAILAGCRDDQRSLAVSELTAGEREVATRFLVLERARALALADTATGNAVLDSLATAWGDTSLDAARTALPHDPLRLAAFYDLLARLLQTERDSLATAPARRRLAAPLPGDAAPAPDEHP